MGIARRKIFKKQTRVGGLKNLGSQGQATVEYILLLSLLTFGVITFSRGLTNVIDKGILVLGGQLEKDLKTGRAPLSVWQN